MKRLEGFTLSLLGLFFGTTMGGYQLFTGDKPSDYWIGVAAVGLAFLSAIALGRLD